jgi:hypothetical protein
MAKYTIANGKQEIKGQSALPQEYALNIGISGDFVKVHQEGKKIVIEKA